MADSLQRPTLMEIVALADEVEDEGLGQVDLVRRALARWGRTVIEPVPVSKRLPDSEDCTDLGMCWLYSPQGDQWNFRGCADFRAYTHWLPHWVIPLPPH